MRFSLCLLATAALALGKPHTPGASKDVEGSFTLKQAKREDIVVRASRPRPKRATISGGPASGQQSFVLQVYAPGQTYNGYYAATNGNPSGTSIPVNFKVTSPSQATLFRLNSSNQLVRVIDGAVAAANEQTNNPSPDQKASAVYMASTSVPFTGVPRLVCSLATNGLLSCHPDTTTGVAQDDTLVCSQDVTYDLGVPGADSLGGNCQPVQIYAYAAY